MGWFKNIINNAILGSPAERELSQMREYMRQSAARNHPSPIDSYDNSLVAGIEKLVDGGLFGSERYEVAPPPQGSFSTLRDVEDRKLAMRAGSDNQDLNFLVLPVTTKGKIIFDGAVDANAFALLPRLYDSAANQIESSDTARISVEFNHTGAFIPFSFQVLGQGVQKADLVSYSGKITWLKIRVEAPSLDSTQASIIIGLAKDISLLAPYGGISLYARPMASAGNPQTSGTESVIGAGVSAPSAAASPVSSPTSSPSGGGTGGFVGPGGTGTGDGGTGRKI